MKFRVHMKDPDTLGDAIAEPTLHVSKPAIQRLMDELWRIGVRPSNGEGNAGQLRRIVFNRDP